MRTETMNNQPEQTNPELDITADEFRFLSELLDSSYNQRCENSTEISESLDIVEVL